VTSLSQAIYELSAAESRFVGYLPLRIPHELDQYPSKIVEAYLAHVDERELIQAISPRSGRILAAYSERQASRAVRDNSECVLRRAVIAIGLSLAVSRDLREEILVLPLLLQSASLVELEIAPFLMDSTAPLSAGARSTIINFSQREPRNKSLQSMGFVEAADEDGFRYKRTW
jgi:hypothetical protein